MAVLLEYRKINDVNVPLYFKFSAIPMKDNLTADKLMTLENWVQILDELNPLLASDPNADPNKRKKFEIDSGRLSVNARWAKVSDADDMGIHIVKILNLSSSNAGKYFLKIDVKPFASELEQKSKSLYGETKEKEYTQDVHNSSKTQTSRSPSKYDMLPMIKKDLIFNETTTRIAIDDLNNLEQHIPAPSATSSFLDECPPVHTGEKNCTQTEISHIEYSPIPLKRDKSSDNMATHQPLTVTRPAATCSEKKLSQIEMNKVESMSDKSKKSDFDRMKKCYSYENGNNDSGTTTPVSSGSKILKRRMAMYPKREEELNRAQCERRKKKYHEVQSIQNSRRDIRSLMKESVESLLATYPQHEDHLQELFEKNIKIVKGYAPNDIPDMASVDMVSAEQFNAMMDFLKRKLVPDVNEKPHYNDVIFELLMPEWTFAIFCRKFHCSRTDVLDLLREQGVISNL